MGESNILTPNFKGFLYSDDGHHAGFRYNAEDSINDLLLSISKHLPLDQVYVVDDGSSDRTSQIACSLGVNLVRHPTNCGKGVALRSGLKSAFEESNVLACITMDADGQHEPVHIPDFLSSFHDQSADLIIGARRMGPAVMPIMRVLSNRITSLLISAKIGQKILDSQCGYRLINEELVKSLHISCKHSETVHNFKFCVGKK